MAFFLSDFFCRGMKCLNRIGPVWWEEVNTIKDLINKAIKEFHRV